MSIFHQQSSFNLDLIKRINTHWKAEPEKKGDIFQPNSDRLESFISPLTLKSHDWNTEYEYWDSLSFLCRLVQMHFKPQRLTFSAAYIFRCSGDMVTEIEGFVAAHCIMSIDN